MVSYLPVWVCVHVCICVFQQNQLYHLDIFSNLPLFFLRVFIPALEALFSLTVLFKSAVFEPS